MPERPELPETMAEVRLIVKDSQPFYFQARRILRREREIAINFGRIGSGKDYSCLEYAFPIVMVRKKNGETCMCVDFRTLNKMLLRIILYCL